MIKEIIDVGLTLLAAASIKENCTEAKTKKEREEQRERRKAISNLRNASYILRRFVR